MAAQIKLRPTRLPLPAMPAPVDPLQLIPDHARIEAERCIAVIRPALIRVQQGVSINAAAKWLASSAEGMPSVPTLRRWLRDYIQGGVVELAPKYLGRQRRARGWEAMAADLYADPTHRGYGTIAWLIKQAGFTNVNKKAVERYIKSLPSSKAETNPKRLGRHYYEQNVRPHVVRDNSMIPVGFVYQGDGHRCDVYVAHPSNGKPIRPEITVWIDVRSQYVVGWWMSQNESAHTTLFSLSQAMVEHQHVPAMVHTDPGSGFKNRMICDETAGFLAKFNIRPMLAIPGNAKGKGLIEGWFRWFEERCGKNFATFCGHCRTDDALSRLRQKCASGELPLPTLRQYLDAVRAYIAAYNASPKESLGGKAPADLWEQLERVELHSSAEALLRPREECTVRRGRVRLDGRLYQSPRLLRDYNLRQVIVEYSIHDDGKVWVHDQQGRYVEEAYLVERRAGLTASRLEDAAKNSLKGQHQRALKKMAEQTEQAAMPISTAAMMDALTYDAPQLPSTEAVQLEHGHSFLPAPAATKVTPIRRGVDTAALLEARESVAAEVREAANTETPPKRFARWLALRDRARAGEQLADADAQWVGAYAESNECQTYIEIQESFGYVPGATSEGVN